MDEEIEECDIGPVAYVMLGTTCLEIYFHADHDRRINYYTIWNIDGEFRTIDEAKAFAKTYLSLIN